MLLIRSFCATASVLLLATSASAGISVVDISGGGDYTDIQSAINASIDGDTILVRPGTYGDFLIEDRTINVFADGTNVIVSGTVYISNLSAPKRVVLSGLAINARSIWPKSWSALALNVNEGAIRVEKCSLRGGAGTLPLDFDHDAGAGGDSVDLFFCTNIAFVGCTIKGGAGGNYTFTKVFGDGGNGGRGVIAKASAVALYDCDVRGGFAGSSENAGGDGGIAYNSPTGGFTASGTSFLGGAGGAGSLQEGGNGGHAIVFGANANAHLLDSPRTGGMGGASDQAPFGTPGLPISGAGYLELLSGEARQCTAATTAAPASMLVVTVNGQPGDEVFLPWSTRSAWRYRLGNHGTWLVPYPARMTAQPLGVIPASGVLITQIPLAALPLGEDAALTCVQLFVVDALGGAYVGSPVHVLRK